MPDLTELLRRASEGDAAAANAAYDVVYDELRSIARRLMDGQSPHHTLDAEGLLHEAYVKVSAAGRRDWTSRGHFLAVMSCAMRQHLIDHARGKRRRKRGGGAASLPLSGVAVYVTGHSVDLVAIHEALASLEASYPETARVLELKAFVGLTSAEVAAALEISKRTVARELEFGRTFLEGELEVQ